MVGLGLLVLAGVVLSVGADLFTEHASDLARHWHVHPVAIGLLLAGAEPEELVTALTAAHRHRDALAVGDVIGANVTMLTLVVGIAALLGTFPISPVRGYFGAALVCSVAAAAAVFDGTISRTEGFVLVGGFGAFVYLVMRRERSTEAILQEPRRRRISALWALTALLVIVVGGWLAVTGAEDVVDRFDLGDSAVGLTLVALATSGELFALLWASRRRGVTEFALAAIAGSVAANATASLGVATLVSPPLHTGQVWGSAVLACAACGLLLLLRFNTPAAMRIAGALFIGVYLLYVGATVSRG